MTQLPITVVFPTLNCRHKLEHHVASCREWIGYVAELVIVDSLSSDGSMQFLQKAFEGYNARFISTGPGLYAAWNRGVREASSPYVYFSTIGEGISGDGLRKLHRWCDTHALDVAISSPRILNTDGTPATPTWPIHELSGFLLAQGEVYIPDAQINSLLGGIFLPRSIMGSSASNLYRTSALVAFPFPENVGPQGDVLWGAKFFPRLRVGLSGQQFSTFLYDGVRGLSFSDYTEVVRVLQREVLDNEEREPDLCGSVCRSVVKERLRFGNRLSHLRAALDRRKRIARFLRKVFGTK